MAGYVCYVTVCVYYTILRCNGFHAVRQMAAVCTELCQLKEKDRYCLNGERKERDKNMNERRSGGK
jgi:hypothetical protein